MPTFGGVNIFGVAVVSIEAINPRSQQDNSYPALNGVESLDLGSRGRMFLVTGRLIGVAPSDLNAAIQAVRNAWDGVPRVFVDPFGNAWPFVKIQSYEPEGRVTPGPPGFAVSQRYSMRLHSLT